MNIMMIALVALIIVAIIMGVQYSFADLISNNGNYVVSIHETLNMNDMLNINKGI
jgi:uncharacterized membrane protein YvbJ